MRKWGLISRVPDHDDVELVLDMFAEPIRFVAEPNDHNSLEDDYHDAIESRPHFGEEPYRYGHLKH